MVKSRDIFANLLRKHYEIFQSCLASFVFEVGSSDMKRQMALGTNLLGSLESIRTIVPTSEEQPEWCKTLYALLKNYLSQEGTDERANANLTRFLTECYGKMMTQEWSHVTDDDSPSVDVDGVIRDTYAASNVERTFDDLIAQLQLLIENDAIDTVVALKSLKGLIALIKKNKKNPMSANFALGACWNFLINYLDKLATDEKANPYLKPVTQALRQTLKDAEEGVVRVFQESGDKVNSEMSKTIPIISSVETLRITSQELFTIESQLGTARWEPSIGLLENKSQVDQSLVEDDTN